MKGVNRFRICFLRQGKRILCPPDVHRKPLPASTRFSHGFSRPQVPHALRNYPRALFNALIRTGSNADF